MNDPCYDVKRFLELLHPEGVFELRSPECPKWPGANQLATASGWFNDHAKAADEAAKLEKLEVRAVYCTLNVCNPRILGRRSNRTAFANNTTADKDIERRTNLLIDIDPSRLSDTNSTDEEMAAALELARKIKERLESESWPEILVGMSGNGATLIARIDLANDDASTLLIQKFLNALADAFDNEIVHVDRGMYNASRITKVQGTMTRKGDDVVGQTGIPDMPQRRSWFIDMQGPRQVTPVELIEAWASKANLVDEKAKGKSQSNRPSHWLDTWLADHSVPVNDPISIPTGRKWFFRDLAPPCSSSPSGHGCDRGQYLIEFRDGTIIAGCHHTNCSWDWQRLRLHYEPDAYDDPMHENVDVVIATIDRAAQSKSVQPVATTKTTTTCGDNPNNSRENDSNHRTAKKHSADFIPFPTEVLPLVVADFIKDTARAIDCDESFVALPAIAALGAAVGNSRMLELKASWYVPPVLWTVIVAPSGACKSPAFKLAIRPTQSRQRRLLKKYDEECKEFEKLQAAYLHELKEFKKNKSALPPTAPDEPVCERVIADDTTIEALGKRLADSPRGILVAKDELASWFVSFSRYKTAATSDEARWLEFYSGHRSIIDRASSKRPIVIPRAFVCLTGTIQPEILRKSLTSDHKASGLAARLVFAMPPKRPRKWTDFQPSKAVIERFESLVDNLFDLELQFDNYGDPMPKVVTMTNEAKKLFTDYFTRHNKEQDQFDGELYAAYSKLEEVAARVALIVHCIENVSTWSDADAPLSMDSMCIGIQICEWFKNEAQRVYASLADPGKASPRMIEWIRSQPEPVTPYDLHRAFRQLPDSSSAEDVIRGLVADGLGAWVPIQNAKGGKPTRGFKMHGAVVTS